MRTVAIIQADLESTPLQTKSRLAEELAHGLMLRPANIRSKLAARIMVVVVARVRATRVLIVCATRPRPDSGE